MAGSKKTKAAPKHVPFKALYAGDVFSNLKSRYNNVMEVPKIEKITLNMGVGRAVNDKKEIQHAERDMQMIAGQKPIITHTRVSEAGFKIRKGWPIGVKVTLRGDRMYDFLERLICVVLPSVRDFRGLTRKSFDGRGNYNLGLREQIVFPELDYENIESIRGLNITITTTARDDEEGYALLSGFHFPFIEKHLKD